MNPVLLSNDPAPHPIFCRSLICRLQQISPIVQQQQRSPSKVSTAVQICIILLLRSFSSGVVATLRPNPMRFATVEFTNKDLLFSTNMTRKNSTFLLRCLQSLAIKSGILKPLLFSSHSNSRILVTTAASPFCRIQICNKFANLSFQ